MSQAARNVSERQHSTSIRPVPKRITQLVGLVFLLLVLGLLTWGGWVVVKWMNDANQLPLTTLVITGERQLTTDDDIRQAILSLGEPKTFMAQDVNEVQQQILNKLPWLKHVSVRKQWPDELKIHVVEFVPYVLWNDALALDAEGTIFALPRDRLGNKRLVQLYGPADNQKMVLDGYQEMQQRLDTYKIKIQAIAVSPRLAWQVLLADGAKLELGRDDRMLRLERFITLYPVLSQQTLANQHIISIDLRYETGAAVSFAANDVQ